MRCHKNLLFPVLLAFVFLFSACAIGRNDREAAVQEWLLTAERPVQVTKHCPYDHITSTRWSHFYTLVDSEGRVFLARNVRFELPDVIE
jgi:hypothetical protein